MSDNTKEKEVEVQKEEIDINEVETEIDENKEEINENADESSKEPKEETVDSMKKELNALQEKYVRVYADFDNTKKRLEKDKFNAIDYAIESFSKDMLSVFDSLELALKSSQNKEADSKELLEKLIEGLKLTSTQFESIMLKNNIEKIETDGEFNHNIHNAVMQVDAEDTKSGEIVQVLQAGYKLKNRILRPAMVSVAK